MMLGDASAATAPLIAAAATIAPPFAAPALALLAAAGVELSRGRSPLGAAGGGGHSPHERDPIVAASLEYVDPQEMDDWARLATSPSFRSSAGAGAGAASNGAGRPARGPVERGVGPGGMWDRYEHEMVGGRSYLRHTVTGQCRWCRVTAASGNDAGFGTGAHLVQRNDVGIADAGAGGNKGNAASAAPPRAKRPIPVELRTPDGISRYRL